MKKTKIKKLIFSAALLISGIIAIGSYDIATTDSQTSGTSKAYYPMFRYLNGTIEFNIVPQGDSRVWHIESKYNSLDTGGEPGYNRAEYTFTDDSVNIISEYAGVPNHDRWGISLVQVFLNPFNLNNQ